jgi:hypothetical protein
MAAFELLAQVCDQTSEDSKDQIMFFTLLGLQRVNCFDAVEFRRLDLDRLQGYGFFVLFK